MLVRQAAGRHAAPARDGLVPQEDTGAAACLHRGLVQVPGHADVEPGAVLRPAGGHHRERAGQQAAQEALQQRLLLGGPASSAAPATGLWVCWAPGPPQCRPQRAGCPELQRAALRQPPLPAPPCAEPSQARVRSTSAHRGAGCCATPPGTARQRGRTQRRARHPSWPASAQMAPVSSVAAMRNLGPCQWTGSACQVVPGLPELLALAGDAAAGCHVLEVVRGSGLAREAIRASGLIGSWIM